MSPRTLLIGVVVATLIAAACSSTPPGDADAASADAPGRIVELPRSEEGEPIPLEPAGVVVNKYDLQVGGCFNQYTGLTETGSSTEETRSIDCNEPHESEVFLQLAFPAAADAAYPGVSQMISWAEQRCYEAFEDFVGLQYELSVLEIGTLQPTVETWTGAGLHREVTCFVYSFDGNALQGSMVGSGV